MLNDPAYALMVTEARKGKPPQPKTGPPLATWSAEVAVLADIVDAVRENTAVTAAAAGAPAKQPPRYDRPRTAFDRIQYEARENAHRKLVARVLPGR